MIEAAHEAAIEGPSQYPLLSTHKSRTLVGVTTGAALMLS